MPITAGMVSAASGLKNPAGSLELGYRTNLVANPNFETSSASWSANGAGVTVERSTEEAYGGSTASLKSVLSTGAFTGPTYGASGNGRIPITPNESYRFSLYLKTPATNTVASYRLRIRTFTALVGGSAINLTASTATEIQPGADWIRLTFAPAFTDPGIAACTLIVDRTTAAPFAGESFYIDNVLFEKATTFRDYFDGNTAGAFWGGTANLSISGTSPY